MAAIPVEVTTTREAMMALEVMVAGVMTAETTTHKRAAREVSWRTAKEDANSKVRKKKVAREATMMREVMTAEVMKVAHEKAAMSVGKTKNRMRVCKAVIQVDLNTMAREALAVTKVDL